MTNLPISRLAMIALSIALATTIYTVVLAIGHIPGACVSSDCWFPYLGVRIWALASLLIGLAIGVLIAGLDALATWGSVHAR